MNKKRYFELSFFAAAFERQKTMFLPIKILVILFFNFLYSFISILSFVWQSGKNTIFFGEVIFDVETER